MSRKGTRLFIALWPDALVRDQLCELQRRTSALIGVDEGVVACENLHLTLMFLGQTAQKDIPRLGAALETVSVSSFYLLIDRWGHFPGPEILWAGPSSVPAQVTALQKSVYTARDGFGDFSGKRHFKPHVTLYRKMGYLPALDEFDAIEWLVDRFVLVESTMHPDGVKYRVLDEFFAD